MGKLLIIALMLAACGGGDAAPPDAWATTCGSPGDEGNELGVGKFCETLDDCADTPEARFCSNIGDETTWFCVRLCELADPDTICGTGAECVCNDSGNACGCTPSACLQ
jgi:hypothetical protein